MAAVNDIFLHPNPSRRPPRQNRGSDSDAVLDAVLEQDPYAGSPAKYWSYGHLRRLGEITTTCYVDVPKVARETIRDIGYTDAAFGFDCKTCGVLNTIQGQSPDIAMAWIRVARATRV